MTAWEKFRQVLRRDLAGICLALISAGSAMAQDHGQASVFMYHRFGETQYPTTSVDIAQFEAHIAELRSGRYQVMPLEAIVDTLASGQSLPEHAVALTMDDGFASVYREAWPRLRAAGLPFTIFVSTDSVDEKSVSGLSWDQIREMLAAGGVSIGHHGAAHNHMPRLTEAQIDADIKRGNARFKAELGQQPVLFAYPYGEFTRRDRNQIAALGFKAAFGQYSGVVHSGADRFGLPRFALNQNYGALERFRLVANALAFPVRDITPEDPLLTPENNPPAFGFTVQAGITGLERLTCYASNQDAAVSHEVLSENRIEVRMPKPFERGHGRRINCTLPDASGRWRWLGQPFVIR